MAYSRRAQTRRCMHAAFAGFAAQSRCRLRYRLTLAGYTGVATRSRPTETVMKFAAAMIGLLLLASPARAEVDTPTLDSCKRVTADAERLTCYDKAASAPSPKPSEAEMGEAGWWVILGSIDIGRDNNNHHRVRSKTSYRGTCRRQMRISGVQRLLHEIQGHGFRLQRRRAGPVSLEVCRRQYPRIRPSLCAGRLREADGICR